MLTPAGEATVRVPKLTIHEFLGRLGWPGLAGGLLLLASLGYALAGILPAREDVVRAQQRVARAEAVLARVRSGKEVAPQTARQRGERFYAALPAQADVTQWIERIYGAAAAENLSLAQGEYAQVDVPSTRMARYRIVLPLHGTYGQIRRFIAAAAAAVPGLALEDLSMQRQNVGEAEVEARVQLSLYLVKP
jgi:Tfp pilus assembly protein PilO